jgi:hypothetical protein
MTFQNGGIVHYEGVKNEHYTIWILNCLKIYGELVTHKGGTKNKADAIVGTGKELSIKGKKNIRSGSFDWLNTTWYNSIFDEFYADVKQYRLLEEKERIALVKSSRKRFSELCNQCLEEFDTEELTQFISNIFERQTGYDVVVNDLKSKSLHIFDPTAHPAYQLILSNYKPFLFNARNAKYSRKVLFKREEDVVDPGLRMRITSNNGINAFLGLSKKNSNSYVSLKLQQDRVHNLLTTVNSQIYSYSNL